MIGNTVKFTRYEPGDKNVPAGKVSYEAIVLGVEPAETVVVMTSTGSERQTVEGSVERLHVAFLGSRRYLYGSQWREDFQDAHSVPPKSDEDQACYYEPKPSDEDLQGLVEYNEKLVAAHDDAVRQREDFRNQLTFTKLELEAANETIKVMTSQIEASKNSDDTDA